MMSFYKVKVDDPNNDNVEISTNKLASVFAF